MKPNVEHVPVFVLLVGAAAILTGLGAGVWIVLLNDGLLTAALLTAAVGWGAWPTVWLGLGRRETLPQVCIAVALGLGILGLATLGLGAAGLLSRVLAWTLVAVGGVAGLGRVYGASHCKTETLSPSLSLRGRGGLAATFLLIPLSLPLAIAFFGACLPPGVLWNGEARGYDVLEYHLQGPREYFDAGRITFLPHNVYTSFPQQMEMLYLLLMVLGGGPLAGAIPAQLLHASCGVLAVLALAAWTPAGWPRRIVALAAGSVPWLAYLGCLAYVELGMLFFAAVAVGLLLDTFCGGRSTAFAAGLCAGLAGGCKYTALAFVAVGLALAWVCTQRGSWTLRVRQLGLFLAGVLVAFAPWLIRNAAFTGNPVYPFAYGWFDSREWSAEQSAQWARGHRLPAELDTLQGRLRIAWDEVFAARMFGPALFVLALGGLVLVRSRPAAFVGIWFALIVVGWATTTHMPGRFAVPIIVPLALLVGMAAEWCGRLGTRRWPIVVLACIALAGALPNVLALAGQWRTHSRWYAGRGAPLNLLVGATEKLAQVQPLNHLLPPGGKVWLLGEARAFYLPSRVHYTVVFSRDPWLEHSARAAPPDSVAWLRTHNVSVVVFSWPEIERLQRSYGFPTWVTREWANALEAAGLRRVRLPAEADAGEIDVFEVPAE